MGEKFGLYSFICLCIEHLKIDKINRARWHTPVILATPEEIRRVEI
jgi:hypothetical protein